MKEEENSIGLKQWIIKTVTLFVIFMCLIYATEVVLNIKLLSNAFIAITIALFIGFAHEYLHYYKAVKLGYEPKWYRTKVTMGFEISHHSKRDKWMKDKREISRLPYFVLLPLSIVVCLFGLYFDVWGIWLGGVAGLLLHTIAYPLTEGH